MTGAVGEVARRWWSGEMGAAGLALDVALAPAEAAYRLGTALRNRAYERGFLASAAVAIPVISVGNIAVGGTGKTPFTSWLAARLEQRGEKPAIVHGGYAQDEPALLRAWTPAIPVLVDRNRVRAAEHARAAGSTVVILDDAFQHRRLRRDLDIVLVSVERWTGVTRLLPRGPWREPAAALVRAGLIVCVRKTDVISESSALAAALSRATGRPVMRIHLQASAWQQHDAPADAPHGPALLVAGLADPALFAANARSAGADVTTELTFADHHEYTADDADRIRDAAADRAIVTTAKDWVKLRGSLNASQCWVLAQEVVVEAGEALLHAALENVLT